MMFYNKQITQALIRLLEWAGRSVPGLSAHLLFAPEERFSPIEAYMCLYFLHVVVSLRLCDTGMVVALLGHTLF